MSGLTQIGRFKILSQQGAGGMGIIYLGEDEMLGRKAAVKLLGPDRLNDPKAGARFKREATAAARLKHPNIAALYEMGEHDGKPFLAIEWVEGQSLEEVLQHGPLPVPRAMAIIGQVLSTLDYAHAQGVVHRDVKPANLMISGQDRVTLVDFGLAFLLSEPGLTSTGVLFGTPLYLAPEMAGEEDVDGRADLYSAALVLFEMLTGSPPFDPAPPAELISQHLHAPRPALTEKRPDLPAALDPVLERAMAVRREDRFPTGAAFLKALEIAVGSSPPPPRPKVLPYVLAGLTMLSIGLWALSPRQLAPPVVPPRPQIVSPALPEDWEQPGGGPGRDYALVGFEEKPVPRWTRPASGARQMLVSESRVLLIGPDRVEALRADDGQPLWNAAVGGRGLVDSWLEPSLLILQHGRVWRGLRTVDGKEVWKVELAEDGPGGVLADDEFLYLGAGQKLISLSPDTGEEQFRLDLGETVVLPPVARKAGAFVATEKRVVAVDSFAQRATWSWNAPTRPTAIALSPDESVLVGCERGEFVCLPILSGESYFEKQLDTDREDEPQAVAGIASVPGRAAVVGSAGEVTFYYTLSAEADPLWKIDLDLPPAGPPLTDGERVLVTTREGELLAYKGGRESWKMDLGGVCPTAPVPAGQWLYVLAGDKLTAYGPK